MLKIVAISDTHNRHRSIKDFQEFNSHLNEAKEPLGGDIIIHAGDATGRGEHWEIESFLKWFSELDFRYKVFIPGNHDFGFEKNPALYKTMCKDLDIILLIHDSIDIEGIKIFGSAWSPFFYNWAFNGGRTLAESHLHNKPLMRDLWKSIPFDTNVLVTHGPPYEILDELVYVDGTPKGQFVGCVDLKEKIEELKDLDIHIFGHIHCAHGQKHINGVSYYNASICDEMYSPSMPVTIIEYEKETK
jgi:Icc-related predicted phosphoesterase